MARHKTWALVTDGVRARILRNLEGGGSEDPIELVSKAESSHLRGLLSGKSGRGLDTELLGQFSQLKPRAHPVIRDMQDFACQTLDFLEGHFRAGHLTRLAIFAAPKMLGILRQVMPASLKDAVILERDLYLIELPEADLRDAVIRELKEG